MALQLVPLWLLLMPAAFTANAVVVDIPLSSDGGIANWTLSSAPAGAADQHISTVSVPALVPGDVNDDLERSGHLPDLWVADNSVDVPWWVPIRTWTYTAEFPTPSSAQHTSTTLAAVDLRFEGVDYNATFVLNGKTLGSHMGSFLPIVYDVAALLRAGSERNVLAVIIHPPTDLTLISALYNGSTPMYGLDHCKQRREMPWWKSVLNQWDFACKYYQIGIWRGVSLHIGAPGSRGSGAKLQTLPTVLPHLAPPYTTATLELRGAVLLDPLHLGKQLRLQWSVECLTDPGAPNASVYSTAIGSAPTTAVNASVQLRSPRLWWPNGYGKQNRYRLTLTLLDSDANILDSTGALFGVRHLQNLENEHDKSWLYNRYGDGGCGPCLWNSSTYPECNRTDGGHRALTCSAEEAAKYPSPSRWLFAINGRRVFARGGNWVPGDLAFGRLVRQKRRFRALLSMARALGYTYIRIWGGGLLEDSQFYDYADEFGIMLQQDFPLAGCGFSPNKTTGSWAWLNESIPRAGGVSVLGAFEEQLPIALRQLMNHPSIVRYTLGNELYLNRTQCPVERVFEDTLRAIDPTRMTRQADPTTVGQRHGPYHFDVASGSGYDAWGGRWPLVSSCASSNYESVGCCNDTADKAQAGCRYDTHDGGPGDPFEWSEFGSNAMSDIQTLRYILPAASLTPAGVGDRLWQVHKAGMWLDQDLWTAVFTPASAAVAATASPGQQPLAVGAPSPFEDMKTIVAISQWVQAEGYRYAYQAGRRRKWHRSLMASWTMNEPWPNAAHGCVVDYYGLPKHAFYTVRQSMQMLDVSLSYSDIHAVPNEQLRATVWVDSELDTAKQLCTVQVMYFTPAGEELGTERITAADGDNDAADDDDDDGYGVGFVVPAAKAIKLRQLAYKPPARLQGDVVIVRLSLLCVETGSASAVQLATNDYTFGIAALSPPPPPPAKGCTIDTGFDWKPNLPGQRVVSAKDAGECCHACAAQPGCKAGSLFDGRCWLKDEAAAVSKFAKPGVTSCQPSNRTVVAQHAHSPLAAHEGKAGPLRAMLDVANASLSLTVVGNVMHVSTANESSSSPCALYVKPTLRNATGHQLGYVTFSQGFQIMRPGEAAALQVVTAGVGLATHACVEAWNAPRVCAALPI